MAAVESGSGGASGAGSRRRRAEEGRPGSVLTPMEALAPAPEPEPTVVTTTTTVVKADDKAFTTTTVVTVPHPAKATSLAPAPLVSSMSADPVVPAADVKGEAPATPNTMTRSPFETVFDPAADRSDEALRDFLVGGGCSDCTSWEPDGFSQLRKELEKGEATLGLDAEGRVKRVVSVAKPVGRDPHPSLFVRLFPPRAQYGCALADDL